MERSEKAALNEELVLLIRYSFFLAKDEDDRSSSKGHDMKEVDNESMDCRNTRKTSVQMEAFVSTLRWFL